MWGKAGKAAVGAIAASAGSVIAAQITGKDRAHRRLNGCKRDRRHDRDADRRRGVWPVCTWASRRAAALRLQRFDERPVLSVEYGCAMNRIAAGTPHPSSDMYRKGFHAFDPARRDHARWHPADLPALAQQAAPAIPAEAGAMPAGKLSGAVVPRPTGLDLTVNPAKERFSGHVEIEAEVKQAGRSRMGPRPRSERGAGHRHGRWQAGSGLVPAGRSDRRCADHVRCSLACWQDDLRVRF